MAKKILVIDDDPVVVKYLVSLLEDNGYETCMASDGKEAMDVLKAERPDLITLDLEMPNEWGTRFYRKFKQNPELKETPVLIISGMPSRHLSVKDAIGYLAKPFEPDKVLELVKGAIG
ncbi:response regulator [Desulfonema ishimotonii]|uniref:Response regulator n=1 Tax=Desulfonema ishimotonii TaxID=45657 RepID=A0A401FZE3_9BACT|nr:response regulator [Desulfonema ishimotonii]GBC62328.1 response regulator [Desulfonema ishimotonii]